MSARLGQHVALTQVPRKFTAVSVEVKAVSMEIEVPADASVYGVAEAEGGLTLFLGVPEGSGPVRRKLWVVPQGSIIAVEAQNGEFLGSVVLTQPQLFHAAVFIETQKQAIERATYRAGFRAPPSIGG